MVGYKAFPPIYNVPPLFVGGVCPSSRYMIPLFCSAMSSTLYRGRGFEGRLYGVLCHAMLGKEREAGREGSIAVGSSDERGRYAGS